MSTHIIARIHEMYQAKEVQDQAPSYLAKVDGQWVLQKVSQELNKTELVADLINEIDPDDEPEITKVLQEVDEIFKTTVQGIGEEVKSALKKDEEECQAALKEKASYQKLRHKVNNEKLRAKILFNVIETDPYSGASAVKEQNIKNDETLFQMGCKILENQRGDAGRHMITFLRDNQILSEQMRTQLGIKIVGTYLSYPSHLLAELKIIDENNLYKILVAMIKARTMSDFDVGEVLSSFEIKNEKLRLQLAIEVAQNAPAKLTAILPALKITETDQLAAIAVEALKKCADSDILQWDPQSIDRSIPIILQAAQKNGRAFFDLIEYLPNMNDRVLGLFVLEVAKNHPDFIFGRIQKIKHMDKAILTQIVVELAKYDMEYFSRLAFPLQTVFGITDDEQLTQIALAGIPKNPAAVLNNIDAFGIKDEECLKRIISGLLKHVSTDFYGVDVSKICRNFKKFGFQNNEDAVVEIAIELANKDPRAVLANIQDFGIKDPKNLVKIAKAIAKDSSVWVAELMRNFNIKDPSLREEVAREVKKYNVEALARNINNFALEDPVFRYQAIFEYAQEKPKEFVSLMRYRTAASTYGIEKEEDRARLAVEVAKKAPECLDNSAISCFEITSTPLLKEIGLEAFKSISKAEDKDWKRVDDEKYYALLADVGNQNTDVFLTFIPYLEVKDKSKLGAILISLLPTHALAIADTVHKLDLGDDVLIEIAEEIRKLPITDKIAEIKKMGIQNEEWLTQFVIEELKQAPPDRYYGYSFHKISNHLKDLNIKSESLRTKIALAIVKLNPDDFINNIEIFGIKKQAHFEEIVLALAKEVPRALLHGLEKSMRQDQDDQQTSWRRGQIRFRIEDEELLKKAIWICMQEDLRSVTGFPPYIPFKSEAAWVEFTLEIGKRAEPNFLINNIDRYPIQNEETRAKVLIEILKLHPADQPLASLKKFNITNLELLRQICSEIAVHNPKLLTRTIKQLEIEKVKIEFKPIYLEALQKITSTGLDDWDPKDQTKCLDLLLRAAKEDASLVLSYLPFAGIKQKADQLKILCKCLEHVKTNVLDLVHQYRLYTNEEMAALAFAQHRDNPYDLLKEAERLGLKGLVEILNVRTGSGWDVGFDYRDEEKLISHLISMGFWRGEAVGTYISYFKIKNETDRAKIAEVVAASNPQLIINKFENFDVHDEKLIGHIYLKAADSNPELIAQNMGKLNIVDGDLRAQIAGNIAYKNPNLFFKYINNFLPLDEKAKIEIANYLAKASPELLSQNINMMGIVNTRALTKIILMIIDADINVIKSRGVNHFGRLDDFEIAQIASAIARKDPALCARYIANLNHQVVSIPLIIMLSSNPEIAEANKSNIASLLSNIDQKDQPVLQEILLKKIADEKNIAPAVVDQWCEFFHRQFGIFPSAKELKNFLIKATEKKGDANSNSSGIDGKDLLFFADLLANCYLKRIDLSSDPKYASVVKALFDLHNPVLRSELLNFYYANDVFIELLTPSPIQFKSQIKVTYLRPLIEGALIPFRKGSAELQRASIEFFEKIYGVATPQESQEDIEARRKAKKEAKTATKPSAEEILALKEARKRAKEEKAEAAIAGEAEVAATAETVVSLKDAKNEQTVLQFLLYLQTNSQLDDENRSMILQKLGSASTQKEAFEAMKAIPIIVFLRGFGEISKTECSELPKLVEILFQRLMSGQYISNLGQKLENTIMKFRKKDCIFTYAAQLKDRPLEYFKYFMADVLNGEFYAHRYDHNYQPHLEKIFEPRELLQLDETQRKQKVEELKTLEGQWKKGEKLKSSQLRSMDDFKEVVVPSDFGEFTVEDTDNPNDILLCGEEVDNSCQKITNGGANNNGLLGYLLNGYNRIVVVKNGKGEIIGRVLLRLYYDTVNKVPVLYQDVLYTNAKGLQIAAPLINAMCLRRAKAMNLTLTTAGGNNPYQGTIEACGGRSPIEYSDAVHGLQSSTQYLLPAANIVWEPESSVR